MNNKFNLQKLCKNLIHEIEEDSNRQNIIKLSIDASIPKEFYGHPEVCEELLKEAHNFFADKIVNGIINIDLIKKSENEKETTLNIKISGDDNITHLTSEEISDLISAKLSDLKNKFEDLENLVITREGSALLFTSTFQNVASKAQKKPSTSLVGKQILIAEDNEINAMVFSSFLEDWGCISSFAINGLEALQMVQENDYDLILMDIHMPVLNGIEATAKIREFDKNIPIVALTASDLEQDYNSAQLAGISDYLIKPISSQLLRSVMSKCLFDAIDES